jgi:dynein heavy chain, axonemal
VTLGDPLLVEDVEEELEASAESVLMRNVYQQDGAMLIKISDKGVNFNPDFRLFMTSKLPNPHFLPDVFIKSTVINFTVTLDGLEDQLLVDVVKHENPEVERQRDEIILSISIDKKVLKQCQDKILELLANSTGMVLDDELLITTLEESKNRSTEISRVLASSADIEAKVNEARDIYRPVATRGAVLYFVISDLGLLDPMYQYSLGYFKKLFTFSLDMEDPVNKRLFKEKKNNLF